MPQTYNIQPRALRIRDAVRYSSLSRATLFRLIASGELASAKVGHARLIDRASLDALLRGVVVACTQEAA